MRRAAIEAVFYGHLFYGVCAVAQIAETTAQLSLPVNPWLNIVAFLATVMFYNFPYRGPGGSADPRVAWHSRHRRLVNGFHFAASLVLIAMVTWMVRRHGSVIRLMTGFEWVALLIFPGAAALYYGVFPAARGLTLRQRGWLKPFVIGFVWAGVVVAYPILFARLQNGHDTPVSLFPILLFIKTLMFISILAMLFDIKDRKADRRRGLSTVVTLVGTRRTLFQVSLPLTVLGIATFLSYATMQHLTLPRVLLVLAPFVLLIAGIVSLTRPRGILYYLIVIDGLMLAKALLDILAMQF